ncbi:MAG: ankyrin repeat domain-containing protein [Armatimonadetes bacterium]|nr:ankyrin repeat domain-containing protein [Armatimonadota bacterium]
MHRPILMLILTLVVLALPGCGALNEEETAKAAQELKAAVEEGDKEKVETILKQHPQAINDGAGGRTALHVAAENDRDGGVLQLLVDRGADLHALDKQKKTPLQVASRANNRKAMDLLSQALAR